MAVTTSLGVVGVGLTTGTANAAAVTKAAFTLDKASGTESAGTPLVVKLDAQTSTAASGAAITYAFDCGDNNVTAVVDAANAAIATCSYTAPGVYHTDVTVTDNASPVVVDAAAKQDVTVIAAEVLAAAASPQTGKYPLPVVVNLAGTSVDASAKAATTTTIHWGDVAGTATDTVITGDPAAVPAGDSKLAHAYATNGTYDLTVVLDDKLTGSGHGPTAPQHIQIKVNANGPTAAINATQSAPYTITADLTGSGIDTLATGGVASYVVDWGDGNVTAPFGSITPAPTHDYKTAGTRTITLTVTDGLGGTATAATPLLNITANQPAPPKVSRGAGDDRYKTGIAVSQHRWADKANETKGRVAAKAVILATGNTFPDALAGVPLAKKANGPLLLTNGTATTVDAGVLGEIQRVLPTANTTVFVLGGTSAMSQGIQDQLTALGYNVVRLAGSDRFGTALAIAQDPRAMNNPASIIVARGDNGTNNDGFADALAAGPYAANVFNGGNSAVVLSNGKVFDDATKAYVTGKLTTGTLHVGAIGGQAVAAMGTIVGAAGNFGQAVGSDRWETAAKVAGLFPVNAPVGVAYGFKFPDALTGGALMASSGGPLLLTDNASTSPFTTGAITKVATTTSEVDVFGGTAAISNTVLSAIMSQVHQTVLSAF